MIKPKISQEDLQLYEILRNPALCTEFIYNLDKTSWEEPFEFTLYQKEILCDFHDHVSVTTARAVGKTVSLSSLIIWMLIFNVYGRDYIVYTVPNRAHLQPVWQNLQRSFRSNSLLKMFIPTGGGFNSSVFEINLTNNAALTCRIAGMTGTGANVIGLHTPVVLLDEAGYYPWGTWVELQPILNTFTEGHRQIVSGVPTGVREKNVLFTADQEDPSYTKHRATAFDNPRFMESDHQHAIEQYGGEDSEDYIHLVLGKHGAPVYALFDRNLFEISNYRTYKLIINGIELKDNIANYIPKLAMFPLMGNERKGIVLFGVDLGYTDPTAITIMYEDINGRLKFHGRVQLNKVSYNLQDKIIDYLDSKFDPSIIAIDQGSSGIAVIQRMQEADEYLHKNYAKRIIPINFSAFIDHGVDQDGKELKTRVRPFSVSVLQEYSNSHRIVYTSTDMELISELERMTYTKSPSGEIPYKTLTPRGGKRGEDHFTSSLLCASLAYYLEKDFTNYKKRVKKLAAPRWIT